MSAKNMTPLQRHVAVYSMEPLPRRRLEPVTGKVLPISRRRARRMSAMAKVLLAAGVALVMLFAAQFAFAQSASAPAATAPATSWLAQLAQQILPVLGAALMAAVTYASAKASGWLHAHTQNAYVIGVWARLDDAVTTAVQALEQTVVKDMQGPLSADTAAKLKSDALALVKSYLGHDGLALLEKIVGIDQLTGFLQGKIEAAVHVVNQQAPAAPAKV